MKKSDYYKQQAHEVDNDLVAMGLYNKALREGRIERFEDTWLPKIEAELTITYRPNGSYTMTLPKYGVIDFFPKANKLLIRKISKWKKPGLRFILKVLFDNKK